MIIFFFDETPGPVRRDIHEGKTREGKFTWFFITTKQTNLLNMEKLAKHLLWTELKGMTKR